MKWRKLNGESIELPIKTAVEKTLQREIADGHKMKVCMYYLLLSIESYLQIFYTQVYCLQNAHK